MFAGNMSFTRHDSDKNWSVLSMNATTLSLQTYKTPLYSCSTNMLYNDRYFIHYDSLLLHMFLLGPIC